MTAPVLEDFRFLLCSAGPKAQNPWHFYSPAGGSSILAELDIAQGSIAWGKNKGGQAQLEVSKDCLRRANRNSSDSSVPAIRHPNWGNGLPPGSTTLWVEYHGKPIWGGLVWELSSSSESASVQLVADEFIGYYDRLRLSTPIPSNQAQNYVMTIVGQLLQNETIYSIRMPLVQAHAAWSSPFVLMDATYLPSAADYYNQSLYVPLWYQWENHRIGDLIRSLQAIGTGFYYRQGIRSTNGGGYEAVFVTHSPYNNPLGAPGGSPTPTNSPYYPRVGHFTLAWGEGTAQTAKRVNWNWSSRQQATRIKVAGKGERGQQVYSVRQTKVNATIGDAFSTGMADRLDYGAPFLDVVFQDSNLATYSNVDGKAMSLVESFYRPVPALSFEVDFGQVRLPILPLVETSNNTVLEAPIGLGDVLWCHVTDPGIDINTQLLVDQMALRFDRRKNVTAVFDMGPLAAATA